MAKGRMIHKKIWDSDQFNDLSISERLLFIGLITMADDEGCFRADAKHWRRMIFYNDRIGDKKVEIMLQHIEELALIVRGETNKGLAGALPSWHAHQTLRSDRSKPSEYIELLVANELPIRFTLSVEEKTSKEKVIESEVSVAEDSFAHEEKNCPSAKDQMMQGFKGRGGIFNDFDIPI